jgi:Uma2 family endonuclease
MDRLEGKLQEYIQFGVRHVWVVDPASRRAWVYSKEGLAETAGVLRTENPAFDVPLSEIVEALDDQITSSP